MLDTILLWVPLNSETRMRFTEVRGPEGKSNTLLSRASTDSRVVHEWKFTKWISVSSLPTTLRNGRIDYCPRRSYLGLRLTSVVAMTDRSPRLSDVFSVTPKPRVGILKAGSNTPSSETMHSAERRAKLAVGGDTFSACSDLWDRKSRLYKHGQLPV